MVNRTCSNVGSDDALVDADVVFNLEAVYLDSTQSNSSVSPPLL